MDTLFFRELEIFKDIKDSQLKERAVFFEPRRFKRGTIIFHEQDEADGVYLIKSGFISIYLISESGLEKVLAILSRGDMFGEMAMFCDLKRSASVKVLEDIDSMFISWANFNRLLLVQPSLNMIINGIVSERLRLTNKQLTRMMNLSSKEKVLGGLCSLAIKYGEKQNNGILISPRLTHSDMAAYVGLARETVTKVIGQLQDEKLIEYKGKKILMHPDVIETNNFMFE